ncbi:MAG: type I phosphomannose isomerase catalytic subunit [Verrucomicrobiia bacterium]|jgi:mannose-6-phosphate isomerase
MLYPFSFKPILMERVWGGRRLGEMYGKALPPEVPIGEAWEITDRPEGVSEITNGTLAGRNLRWLMENHRDELLGPGLDYDGRFPLLIKILDSTQKLSLQVHPPAHKAAELNGEPKTEMWYVADATADAEVFVGLKQGVTPEEFQRRIGDGTVAECFHRIEVARGDVMFIPSGRVHALGAGSVIFEIQQNSNSTYRVFDWNRVGLDGTPRELHIDQAMKSIDFTDFEPSLVSDAFSGDDIKRRGLVMEPLFQVENFQGVASAVASPPAGKCQVVACLSGEIIAGDGDTSVTLKPGEFCLLPACLETRTLTATQSSEWLMATPGER